MCIRDRYLSSYYRELIRWSDIIDGANYQTPEDAVGFDDFYKCLNSVLEVNKSKSFLELVIKCLIKDDKNSIKESKQYIRTLERAKMEEQELISFYNKHFVVKKNVGFIDQIDPGYSLDRYLPYVLFPYLRYRVTLYKRGKKFSISVNFNVWRYKNNRIDLGELCRKLGGGGRHDVCLLYTSPSPRD